MSSILIFLKYEKYARIFNSVLTLQPTSKFDIAGKDIAFFDKGKQIK